MSSVMCRQLTFFGEAPVEERKPVQLGRWNTKLGLVPSFSLPILRTCPGKTEACKRLCYGLNGRFNRQKVREIYENNLQETKQASFVDRMVSEILGTGARVLRLHVIGDFYSAKYVGKWIEIANRLPDVKFFGSTRSWRVPRIRGALKNFHDLPNVYLRASIDLSHLDRPPSGWGVWSIEGPGDPCLHDYGLVENCTACMKCWQAKDTDIRLRLKWGNPTQLQSSMI